MVVAILIPLCNPRWLSLCKAIPNELVVALESPWNMLYLKRTLLCKVVQLSYVVLTGDAYMHVGRVRGRDNDEARRGDRELYVRYV